MSKTSAEVIIDYSPTEQINITCQSNNNNPEISNINNFAGYTSPTIQNDNFAQLSHNIFILDGTNTIAEPSIKPFGYFGNEVSDDDCKLKDSNIKINLNNFNNSSDNGIDLLGVTFYFGNYINESDIEYTLESNTYQQKIIHPTSNEYKCIFSDPKDIKSINLRITETKFPGMHPIIFYMRLGITYNFTEKDISSLVINDEISPITNVLPVNTAELTVLSDGKESNYENIEVLLSMSNKNINVIINGIIDDKLIFIGIFNIDKIEYTNRHELKMSFVSLTKELYDYTLIPESGKNYTLDGYISYTLNGKYIYSLPDDIKSQHKIIYFKKGKGKDLFQQVLFLYGLMVNDFHNKFTITKLNTSKINITIYPSHVIDDVKITRINPINKVTVDTIDYINQETLSPGAWWNSLNFTTVFQGNITGDELFLEFERPANIFRYKLMRKITDGVTKNYRLEEIDDPDVGKVIQTIWSTGTYEPSIPMSDPGTGTSTDNPVKYSWYNSFGGNYTSHYFYTFRPQNVGVITNYKDYVFKIDVAYFIENKGQYTIQKENIINENLLHIEKPSIFNTNNVTEFASNILNYYGNIDLKIDASYINVNYFKDQNNKYLIPRAGDTVYIYKDKTTMLKTTIVKQSIDIGKGFLTKMTGIANSVSIYSHEYMTSNANSAMYMNDNTLI